MTRIHQSWARHGTIASVVLAALAISSLAQATSPPAGGSIDESLLKQFKSAGKDASLSILPVRLGGNLSKQVGEVIALMLERSGMNNLEISDAKLEPPEKGDLEETGGSLARFVQANPPRTDYVLFADFKVTPQRRFSEVRAIIVNKKGEVVWKDRQTSTDGDFKHIKPKEPMDCCALVVNRLRPVLHLGDSKNQPATEGKLARRWREKSGTPDKAEQAALQDREKAFKKTAATGTLIIYPAYTGDQMSKDSATHLAKMINDARLIHSTTAESGPEIAVDRNPN